MTDSATPDPAVPALRETFLERLQRLVSLEAAMGPGANDVEHRLVEHALTSTYWDCCRLGGRHQARRALGLGDH